MEVKKGDTYTGFGFFQVDDGLGKLHLFFTDELERQKKSSSKWWTKVGRTVGH